MARIRAFRRDGQTRIVFVGRLTARDMGRLEHACGDALTREPLQLRLDLRGVTALDRTAAAMLERLELRGAILIRDAADAAPFIQRQQQ
jgi:hypothetical protein